jgi:hypothetical protein
MVEIRGLKGMASRSLSTHDLSAEFLEIYHLVQNLLVGETHTQTDIIVIS